MKKYLLFCYMRLYPNGGMGDYIKDFDKMKDAKKEAEEKYKHCEFVEIVEYKSMKIVK